MTRPSTGRRIPGLGTPGASFLLFGAIGLTAYALVGPSPLGDLVFLAITGAATVAVFSTLRRRPAVRRAWLAVAIALALITAADVIVALGRIEALAPLRSMADLLFMAAYVPLLAAAFQFARGSHRSDRTAFLDTGIVGLAALPFVWEVVVEPRLTTDAIGIAALVALALPVLDIVLVSLAAPLILMRFSRSPSGYLLVAGLATLGLGDTLYSIFSLDGSWVVSTAFVNLAWLGAYLLLGTAALVPSAAELGAVRDPNPGSGDPARLVVLAIALAASPLVVLHETLSAGDPQLLLFAVLSLTVAGLLILRLQRTIGQLAAVDQRFRRFMGHDRLMAVIKDSTGRYVYMNPAAERIRRQTDRSWYGRTDRELFAAEVATPRIDADAEVRRTGSTLVNSVEEDGRVWHTERFALAGRRGDVAILGVDITDRVMAEESARFQARLLASVQDAVVVMGPDRRFTYWNQGATDTFGYSADEMLGQTMDPLVAPGTAEDVAAKWAAVGRGETDIGDWQAQRRDGGTVWVNARVTPLASPDGTFAGFLGVAKDVTARKESELELARLGAAIDNARDAVIVTDGDDRVVYVNPAFERLTGFTAEEVLGGRPADVPAGRAFARALEQARASSTGWRGDIADRRKDGSDLICETSISPIAVDGKPTSGFVTIKRDVTGERAAERATDRQARERALIAETLVALRAGQDPEETASAISRQLVKLPEVAIATVIAFGLDGAATVLGQALQTGDGVTDVTLSNARSEYLFTRAEAGPWVERWVGDPSHPYAALFAEIGIIAHAYAPIVVDGAPLGLLIAGGDTIDAIDRMTERLPALLEFAAITGTLLAVPVADRRAAAALQAEMRSVIDRAAFRVIFQPIVDLGSGAIRGYEALTRFDDGTRPDLRFEQAHRLGLGLALEAACLKAAFAAAVLLPADAWLNVNVSPEVVLSGVLEGLLPSGSRKVVLEITEHQAITDYASFRAAVEPVRRRVSIAVDDAGAGFASLRHIIELAPSMVKLDRSLIEGIGHDTARQAVVTGMVRFSEAAGLTLLAEGIERDDELVALRRLGVQLGQGYLLGRPAVAGPARPAVRRARRASPPRASMTARVPARRAVLVGSPQPLGVG